MDDLGPQDRREFRRWFVVVSLSVIALLIVLAILNAFGLIGWTMVERKVFEESYQYNEARKSEIVAWEAQLAGLRARVADPSLTPGTKAQIEAQMATIEVQLKAAKAKLED